MWHTIINGGKNPVPPLNGNIFSGNIYFSIACTVSYVFLCIELGSVDVDLRDLEFVCCFSVMSDIHL